MTKFLIALVVVVLIGGGLYFLMQNLPDAGSVTPGENVATGTPQTGGEQPTSEVPEDKTKTIIGTSVEKRDITAFHYGEGTTELLFVGGIHGGYEWNTVLVAYQLMDYLAGHPDAIPKNIKVTVIPVLNPDGLNKVVGTADRFAAADVPSPQEKTVPGRFNANNVDLNRNFDCDWKSTGTWQNKSVSGGTEAFSEPESKAFKSYIEAHKPSAVVVWYSAAGGVFASNCHTGVSSETLAITKEYAKASGYPAHESFDFYEITGDMVNWLAKQQIPAISVLLTTHESVEWTKNWAGIEALLKYYAE
ncbi:MAG: M14 family metallopeptidase [Minisyncoccia bacterium]